MSTCLNGINVIYTLYDITSLIHVIRYIPPASVYLSPITMAQVRHSPAPADTNNLCTPEREEEEYSSPMAHVGAGMGAKLPSNEPIFISRQERNKPGGYSNYFNISNRKCRRPPTGFSNTMISSKVDNKKVHSRSLRSQQVKEFELPLSRATQDPQMLAEFSKTQKLAPHRRDSFFVSKGRHTELWPYLCKTVQNRISHNPKFLVKESAKFLDSPRWKSPRPNESRSSQREAMVRYNSLNKSDGVRRKAPTIPRTYFNFDALKPTLERKQKPVPVTFGSYKTLYERSQELSKRQPNLKLLGRS